MICLPLPGRHVSLDICVPPIWETRIPIDMSFPTWETRIPSDMVYPTWETHIPSDMDYPTWEKKHIPSYMCSLRCETNIPSDMCSPSLETHITSNMCSPSGETQIPSDMCCPTWETHIPRDMCSPIISLTNSYGASTHGRRICLLEFCIVLKLKNNLTNPSGGMQQLQMISTLRISLTNSYFAFSFCHFSTTTLLKLGVCVP